MKSEQPRRDMPPTTANTSTRRRTLLLGGIAVAATLGTLFSKKLFGVSFMSHGYQKDFEFIYTGNKTGPNATCIAKTGDGGYVFTAGALLGAKAYLVKLDRQGHQQWSLVQRGSDLRSGQSAHSVLVDGNNGYWLLGDTNSHDLVGSQWDELERANHAHYFYDYTPHAALIAKITPDGTVSWQKVYGVLAQLNENVAEFAVSSAGGLTVVGSKPGKLPASSPVGQRDEEKAPWIFKINEAGDVQWELLIQQDQGRVIRPAPSDQNSFSKPFVDAEGNLYFSVRIEDVKQMRDALGHDILDMNGQGENQRALLIKISPTGKEIARYVIRNYATLPVMVPSANGCDVFFTMDDTAFAHFKLDANLALISHRSLVGEDFRPYAAIGGPNQGFHLLGNSFRPGHDIGRAALAWLGSEGKLQHKETFELQSWPADVAIGENLNEVVVLFTSLIEQVIKVVKYTLKS
jgi:hypothetical protein